MMSKLKLIEVIEIPAEHELLYKALMDCKIDYHLITETVHRLVCPPYSLWQALQETGKTLLPLDQDCMARLLRLNEGKPDDTITWKRLKPTERKRAKRLWSSGKPGRPNEANAVLILYCVRVIEEFCGRAFRFSRPPTGGEVGGPMWRVLLAALPLAERNLERSNSNTTRKNKIISSAAIEEIITTTRLKKASKDSLFAEWSKYLGLGGHFIDIVNAPSAFLYCIQKARTLEKPPG